MKTLLSAAGVNFRSWRHLKFDFQSGIHLIVGETGIGKSSIFLLVYWTLYGELPHTVQVDEVIFDISGKNTSGTVIIKDGSDIYKITRYRKHQQWHNKVIIRKNGKLFGEKDSKVDVIDKAIEHIVGLTADEFLKVVYIAQGDINRFPSLTDLQQKKLLESLTELYIFKHTNNIINERSSKLHNIFDVITERLSQQKESLVTSKQLIARYRKQSSQKVSTIRKDIKILQTKLEEAKARRVACKTELKTILKDVNKLSKRIIEKKMEKQLFVTEHDKLTERLQNTDKLVPGLKCDRCGSILTKETHEETLAKLRSEIEATRKEQIIIENILTELRKERKFIDVEKLREEQRIADALYIKLKAQIAGKKKELLSVDKHSIHANISTLKQLRQKIQQTKNYKIILKHQRRMLKVVTKKFKQIRGEALPEILSILNKKINNLMLPFQQPIRIMYAIEKGKIKQTYMRTTSNKILSFRSLSGGQQQAVTLATNFALWELSDASRASSFDIVLLDEPFAGLSDKIVQKVPQLLSMIKKKKVYVIDHSKTIRPYFQNVIEVDQRDGGSAIING